jgi:ribosomal protein S18 acetylase RimI-like enzyme
MDDPCRLLTLDDVDRAARVMSRALVTDPLCVLMLPNPRTRATALYRFFKAYGDLSIRNGRVYGSGEPIQGVAYWKSPDDENLSISIRQIGRFLPLLFTGYPIGLRRVSGVTRLIDDLHSEHAPEPHFYLDNLAVLPEAQGQGIASHLLEPFLKLADQRGCPTYTDTETESNVAFYEHFGFRCVAEKSVAGTGITVWAMSRPPASSELRRLHE